MSNKDVKVENDTFELKYAPGECEYFCLGDCCLPDTNRSCGTDKNDCVHYWMQQLQRKEAENTRLREALETLLDCKMWFDEATLPHHKGMYTDIFETNKYDYQVVYCAAIALWRVKIAQQALKKS